MVRRALAVVALLGVVLVVVLYGFVMRTGRYELTRLDTGLYVVLDTSTGAHWVYRADSRTDAKRQTRLYFRLEDRTGSWSALKRLYPERHLDEWVE